MYYILQYKKIWGGFKISFFHIEENYCFGPNLVAVTLETVFFWSRVYEHRKSADALFFAIFRLLKLPQSGNSFLYNTLRVCL